MATAALVSATAALVYALVSALVSATAALVSALVSAAVEDLYSRAKDGLSSLFGVKKEVDKLSSTFSAIQAELEDADWHQVTNKQVRDLLLEFKELAYEVEDILDEWVTDACISREDKDETRHPKWCIREYGRKAFMLNGRRACLKWVHGR